MRLIDADTLQYLIQCLKEDSLMTPSAFSRMVDSVPTIDAIPIVRCQDCKHWSPPRDEDDCGYGWCSLTGYIAVKVDYCSQAERYFKTKEAIKDND